MFKTYIICVLLCTFAMAKFIPRFQLDLDAEEHRLLKSAYDTPSYDHDEHEEEDEDLGHGQLDLQKDISWAIKAKLKELKAFNKALAANMLSTKVKLKDLLQNHMDAIKNHHHQPPTVTHQTPAYPHHLPQIQPQYSAQYPAQIPQYPAQNPQYPAQNPQYPAQNPQYPAQKPQYPAQYALQYPYYAQQHGQAMHDPYRGL